MTTRLNYYALEPKAVQAMMQLETAVRESGLEFSLYELVKMRASQINGCAFCLHMHSQDARKAGETEERIHQLGAWEDSPVFTERERAALALTEAVTLLPGGVSDEVYDRAAAHFPEQELARLIAVIFTANAWNRMNVTTRKTLGTA